MAVLEAIIDAGRDVAVSVLDLQIAGTTLGGLADAGLVAVGAVAAFFVFKYVWDKNKENKK